MSSATKFPTPNLDKWFLGDTGSAKLLFDAVQADIAMAVEAARAKSARDRKDLCEVAQALGRYYEADYIWEPAELPHLIARIEELQSYEEMVTGVESAQVTVPEGVRDTIISALVNLKPDRADGYCVPSEEEEEQARAWLESLTVEAKAAPGEKRCETCGYWTRLEDGHPLGTCSCPVPFNLSTSMPTRDAVGVDCPCWKAKP